MSFESRVVSLKGNYITIGPHKRKRTKNIEFKAPKISVIKNFRKNEMKSEQSAIFFKPEYFVSADSILF